MAAKAIEDKFSAQTEYSTLTPTVSGHILYCTHLLERPIVEIISEGYL